MQNGHFQYVSMWKIYINNVRVKKRNLITFPVWFRFILIRFEKLIKNKHRRWETRVNRFYIDAGNFVSDYCPCVRVFIFNYNTLSRWIITHLLLFVSCFNISFENVKTVDAGGDDYGTCVRHIRGETARVKSADERKVNVFVAENTRKPTYYRSVFIGKNQFFWTIDFSRFPFGTRTTLGSYCASNSQTRSARPRTASLPLPRRLY